MIKKAPTIIDVAKEAGVSIGTVSRVLNQKNNVAEKYVNSVNMAIAELGYNPNPIARSLVNPSTQNRTVYGASSIGFLDKGQSLEVLFSDNYQYNFFSGMETALSARSLHFLYAACKDDIKNGHLPLMIRDRKVDGVIIKTNEWQQAGWVDTIASLMPVVLLENRFVGNNISSVIYDNVSASRTIMEYLYNLGHRRIAFFQVNDVASPDMFYHTIHKVERLEGYRRMINELRLEKIPEYEQSPERDWSCSSLNDVAGETLDKWIAMGDCRPTAVYCSGDCYALSLMTEAAKRGLRIPDDLSLVSVMNTSTCEKCAVPLTSMSVPGQEMGQTAVDILCSRIEHPERAVQHITIPGQLIERASCVPPAQ